MTHGYAEIWQDKEQLPFIIRFANRQLDIRCSPLQVAFSAGKMVQAMADDLLLGEACLEEPVSNVGWFEVSLPRNPFLLPSHISEERRPINQLKTRILVPVHPANITSRLCNSSQLWGLRITAALCTSKMYLPKRDPFTSTVEHTSHCLPWLWKVPTEHRTLSTPYFQAAIFKSLIYSR